MRAKKILASMISLALCAGAAPFGAVFAADNAKDTVPVVSVTNSGGKTADTEAATTTTTKAPAATATTTKAPAATTTKAPAATATTTKAPAATTTTKATATTTKAPAATATTTKAPAATATTTKAPAATTTTKAPAATATTTKAPAATATTTKAPAATTTTTKAPATTSITTPEPATTTSTTTKPGSSVITITLGDVNGDKLIDAVDASEILAEYARISSGEERRFSAKQILAADVNGDGYTDAVDASNVLAYYAYLSTGGDITLEDFLAEYIPPAESTTTTTAAETTTTTTSETTMTTSTSLTTPESTTTTEEATTTTETEATTTTTETTTPATTTTTTDPYRVSKIMLSKTEIDLTVGGGGDIAYVTMLPVSALNKEEKWWSSDESVAIVNSEGWISPIGAGTCTVTVQSVDNPDVTAEIKVNVKGADKVTEIHLDKTEIELIVGGGGDIAYVTMLPSTAPNKEEKWWSSDESVAIVDSEGWIIPVGEGTCTVTVQSVDNPYVTAEINVTVTDPNKVKEIILSKTEVIIPVGGGDIVYVTMLPENATNTEEIWWSSNENIAIVDSEGWITGISAGICTITVQSVNNPSVTAEIRVIVSNDLANAGFSAAAELQVTSAAMLPKKFL